MNDHKYWMKWILILECKMGDADHVAYEDALAEWDAVEQLGLFSIL